MEGSVPDVQEHEGGAATRRLYDAAVEEQLTVRSERFLEDARRGLRRLDVTIRWMPIGRREMRSAGGHMVVTG